MIKEMEVTLFLEYNQNKRSEKKNWGYYSTLTNGECSALNTEYNIDNFVHLR